MQEQKLNDIQVSQQTAEQLKKQALQYKKLQETFSQRFSSDNNNEFYILSTKWLNQWKKYVSYDEIVANKTPSMCFGRIILDRINNELQDFVGRCFLYHPSSTHPWNQFMKQGLQENADYVVIDKDIWEFFTSSNQGVAIIRTSNGNGKDKQVAVNLLRLKSVFIDPSVLKSMSNKLKKTFENDVMQVDRKMKLKDYYALIQTTINTFQGNFAKDNSVRIWRYVTNEKDPYQTLFNEMRKQTSQQTNRRDMFFDLNGELLTHEQYEYIEDAGIIDTDLIIFEFKFNFKPWSIRNQAVQEEGISDDNFDNNIWEKHEPGSYVQEKKDSDDESIKTLTLKSTSIKGIVGLSNLGNTCFMNSGTQCISNTQPLVEYFLKNLYFDEINMDNPLGTQGQLVKQVGSLIKKMWCGDKQTITPTNYKKAVGQFQPMFSGYHQNDSSELITYVLDGIHEDLNRVKKKPYIETKDYDGRPDFIVAKESWLNHLARNQSIIVDLIYGQYKSTLKCPNCEQVSITFDPFLMVQLGIPSLKKRTISFKFYWDIIQSQSITIPFDKNKTIPLKEYFKHLKDILKIDSQYLFGYIPNPYNSYDILDENKSIVDIRKNSKKKELCFRKLIKEEIDMKKRFPIQFQNKNLDYSFQKEFNQKGIFIFDEQMNQKQVHLLIFSHLKQFFNEYNTLDYKNQVLNQYYTLLYKTNSNYWNPCAFCNAQTCNNCEIKFNDETIEQVKNRVLKIDQSFNFEIFITWKQCPFKQIRLSDMFDHYIKLYKKEVQNTHTSTYSMNNNSSQGNVSLYDCLQYSQMPEQLNAENTWYCKVCKEHVQAYKSMQIYKAPQILIFTLKRFKTSNILFKQKLEALVDFPINNLDMTDYVINSNTPTDFQKENNNDNGEIKKKKVIYDLYAVSNHFGGLGGGHYTAYAKNKFTNKWYNYDDSSVSQINESSIVQKSAYVLFYQLRTDDSKSSQEKVMQTLKE